MPNLTRVAALGPVLVETDLQIILSLKRVAGGSLNLRLEPMPGMARAPGPFNFRRELRSLSTISFGFKPT